MYKLLALDLDDTLLERDKSIPDKVAAAIIALLESGVIVTLATGRMFTSAERIARQLGVTAPLITYNGALARAAGGQALIERPLTLDQMRRVFEVGERHSYYLQLYNDECIVVEKRVAETEVDPDVHNVPCLEVGRLLDAELKRTPKIMTCGEPADMPKRLPILKEALPDLHITISSAHLLEMMDIGVSKVAALERLCLSLGISVAECVACGDSFNDAEMLGWVGMGCAVANALPAVKQIAGYVAEGERSWGVLEVINKFF